MSRRAYLTLYRSCCVSSTKCFLSAGSPHQTSCPYEYSPQTHEISVCHLQASSAQLICRKWAPKLQTIKRIGSCGMPAGFCCTHSAPGNAIPSSIETTEGQPSLHIGQQIFGRHKHILEDNLSSHEARRLTSLRFWCAEPSKQRSTMKRMSPSSLAQTTARSAIGELVIHIFAPLRTTTVYRLRISHHTARSEPWSGSVRPKQPTHSPVASFGK